METIKNYLETMFATMPNTPSVLKAKSELLQMMEDKYTELISEGKTENEAVGAVIQNFGNLEELADDLGLTSEFNYTREEDLKHPRRQVTLDEVKEYIDSEELSGRMKGIGVFLFITCIIWPIIFSSKFKFTESLGIILMFVSIAIGIALIVLNNMRKSDWDFIKHVPCQIDMMTTDYIVSERKRYRNSDAIKKTVGILLCVFCWAPAAISSDIPFISEDFGTLLLFLFIGLGVFLMIYSNTRMNSMELLLSLNDTNTVSGHYYKADNVIYINKTVQTIMSVFWPTVTCLYFIWSFITFKWYLTWIIWPIASVIKHLVDMNLSESDY